VKVAMHLDEIITLSQIVEIAKLNWVSEQENQSRNLFIEKYHETTNKINQELKENKNNYQINLLKWLMLHIAALATYEQNNNMKKLNDHINTIQKGLNKLKINTKNKNILKVILKDTVKRNNLLDHICLSSNGEGNSNEDELSIIILKFSNVYFENWSILLSNSEF